VAGPTGSGKTSTLYAALGERLRTRPDTNVLTVEDPIEYRLAGITQIQVNHAVDLGFAKVLRAMLRQDPDVIMVGEVRDDDTAQLALEAAMTGHLMVTSLHANNAVGVVQRLEHLGCPRPLIGQSLALVLVQRLARRLCPLCTTREVPPAMVLENLAAHGTGRARRVTGAAARRRLRAVHAHRLLRSGGGDRDARARRRPARPDHDGRSSLDARARRHRSAAAGLVPALRGAAHEQAADQPGRGAADARMSVAAPTRS
jgi:type II secretory ATPase GspE/PulE/Tfp pilus assembly ATPase PilB-like protein